MTRGSGPQRDDELRELGRALRQMALDAVATGAADLVSFGRPFICNPDLVRRLRENAAWNALDPSTLYGGGAKGYTDYPTLDEPVTA